MSCLNIINITHYF